LELFSEPRQPTMFFASSVATIAMTAWEVMLASLATSGTGHHHYWSATRRFSEKAAGKPERRRRSAPMRNLTTAPGLAAPSFSSAIELIERANPSEQDFAAAIGE